MGDLPRQSKKLLKVRSLTRNKSDTPAVVSTRKRVMRDYSRRWQANWLATREMEVR
jgi:hypothetical protein